MAFIRPVCVRADTILAAVMIISYAFIKVLRRKGDKKGKKRNILRNRLIKIKRSEKGWGRFSIVALLVFQTLFFLAFHLLFLNQTSIPKFFSPTRKYPKLMHYLTDTDVQNYNSLTLWTREVMAASAAYVIPFKTMSNSKGMNAVLV